MTFSVRLYIILAISISAALPFSAAGAEIDMRSETFLHIYQLDQPAGDDANYAPLYEYLTLDLTDLGTPGLSFHFHGTGRIDLGEETGTDTADSALSSAYARYQYLEGRGHFRLGRFFLTEGIFMEALDGVHVKQSLGMFGLSLFGGNPYYENDPGDVRGDLLLGARTYFLSPGRLELGLNYLTEDGDFEGEKREEAGSDIWFHPTHTLTLTGRTLYNLNDSSLTSDHLSISIDLTSSAEVILDTTGYRYDGLFQAATNPVFTGTLLNPDDEVRVVSGTFLFRPAERIELSGMYSATNHKEDDPGDNNRSELGMDISFSGNLEKMGIKAANQTGDQPENGFNELRSYVMIATGPLRFSLDAMALMYEEKISGEDLAIQVVGTTGWESTDDLSLSGDLRFTKSPVLEDDIAVVLRAIYGF